MGISKVTAKLQILEVPLSDTRIHSSFDDFKISPLISLWNGIIESEFWYSLLPFFFFFFFFFFGIQLKNGT
jgi:hypothetical protein